MRLLSKRSLGISISDGHAAFAEVEKGLGQVRLVRSGTFPLPPGTDQLHGHPEVAESALVRERKLGRLRSRPGPTEVIVGVAQSALVLRFIELPDVDDAGLEGLVSYELERHLPFPPEEACYSFQKLRRNGNRAQILLVAARRADVERTIAPVEQMGLTPTAVDVSSIAATNALFFHQRHRADEVLSLIEVNGGDAAVNVVSQGVLVSSRTVPLVDGSFSPLFSELKRVSEAVPQAPGKILVCGGTEELCLRLKEEMGVPVEQWSPGSSAVDASAFGLALKGLVKLPIQIDLLPAERKVKRRERVVVAMFALLATVGVFGIGLGYQRCFPRATDPVPARSAARRDQGGGGRGRRGEGRVRNAQSQASASRRARGGSGQAPPRPEGTGSPSSIRRYPHRVVPHGEQGKNPRFNQHVGLGVDLGVRAVLPL